ncbi:MAG TPA: sigma-70 family RNA polymerase sigma factor [Gemmatimonadaceae bacterium]|nr:sigma-70 family RNA polymerase sigma factor [Gemmatimonadaceae bacterium]
MRHRLELSTPDAALVQRIRADGSEAAFEVLYDRHTPRLLQTAWRIVGGAQHDAEDAVQDAWVRAIGALDGWSGQAPFGAWMRGIVVHLALDTLRRQRRFAEDTDVGVVDDAPDDRLDLESAIAALPAGYRAVLVLHDIEGFTHDEIGAQLGITAGTSKGQLFKARRAVRARLAPEPRATSTGSGGKA